MNAQNVLGLYYLQGLGGCPQNFKKASEWLKKAAEQGCESAKKTLEQLPLATEIIWTKNFYIISSFLRGTRTKFKGWEGNINLFH